MKHILSLFALIAFAAPMAQAHVIQDSQWAEEQQLSFCNQCEENLAASDANDEDYNDYNDEYAQASDYAEDEE